MTYNDIIQKAGKQVVKHVSYTSNGQSYTVNDDKIEKIKITEETPLVGTAITRCEITLKDKIDGVFTVEIDATYNNETKSATYGSYYLKEEPTYNANKKTYVHKTYDAMIKSMVAYSPITINYPCTIYDFFMQLTTELGYTNNIASLPNGSMTMTEDIYDGINYTYRAVLDDIAEANGVVFYMDDNEIKIPTLGGNSITINDDILKNKNIEFNEQYGPINTIVLSRSYETDVIYLEDAASVAQNGRCEYKIVDNQLMNGNDRSYYLPAILNQLKGIQYYIYDTELVGYGKLRRLQSLVFNTGGNTYNSYVFNNEITLTAGYKQAIYNERPEASETDYKYANEAEQQLEQASIVINKKIAEVDIRGKTINMTADNIAISSTNFNVDNAGNVVANSLTSNNATITGGDINLVDTATYTNPKLKVTSANKDFRFLSNGFWGKSDTNNGYGTVYTGWGTGKDFYIQGESFNAGGAGEYGFTIMTDRIAVSDIINVKQSVMFPNVITTPKISAGNIDCGTCTLSSSSDTQVNFNKTFASAPIVVLTCTQNNTGQIVYAGSVIATTTTSFTAFCMTNAVSASNISFNWIAIGS